MTNRKLNNWLEGYLEYTNETESPKSFNLWSGVSAIASGLRKKVKFQLGRLSTYPNLYIILVAEPGVSRKTTAIDYSTDITKEVDAIIHSADSTTRESLIEDLELAAQDQLMPDGSNFKHNSLSIISREFESFIGEKSENTKIRVLLTDLFDCGSKAWEYKTKNKGKNKLNAVYLNLLAATTPDSLACALPASAIGGGLTSRILFILPTRDRKKFAEPPIPDRELVKALIHDLEIISRLAGVYRFSESCREKWIDWYNKYDGESIYRICKDRSFSSWYSRKSVFIQKLSVILLASRSDEMVIEWDIVEEAIAMLEGVERTMLMLLWRWGYIVTGKQVI